MLLPQGFDGGSALAPHFGDGFVVAQPGAAHGGRDDRVAGVVYVGARAEQEAHAVDGAAVGGVDEDRVAVVRGRLRVGAEAEQDGDRLGVAAPGGPH